MSIKKIVQYSILAAWVLTMFCTNSKAANLTNTMEMLPGSIGSVDQSTITFQTITVTSTVATCVDMSATYVPSGYNVYTQFAQVTGTVPVYAGFKGTTMTTAEGIRLSQYQTWPVNVGKGKPMCFRVAAGQADSTVTVALFSFVSALWR